MPMGLLFVVNDPPAAMEDELNAWYDTEHIPERVAIDGFLSGLRYVSADRPRRYLALYDLTGVEVLQSPAYKAFVGERFTPWTKRILARTKVQRCEAIQTYPGNAATISAPCHLVLRWTGLDADAVRRIEEGAKRCFEGQPSVTQVRVFSGSGSDAGSVFLLVAGAGRLAELCDHRAFSGAGGRLDMLEAYLAY